MEKIKNNKLLEIWHNEIEEELKKNISPWISKKNNYWRYSNLHVAKKLLKSWQTEWEKGHEISTSQPIVCQPSDLNEDFSLLSKKANGYILAFSNGILDLDHCVLPEKKGIIIKSLPALCNEEKIFEKIKKSFLKRRKNLNKEALPIWLMFRKLVLSNPATYTYVDIPEETSLDKPLYAIFVDNKDLSKSILPSHLQLNMGKNSFMEFVEIHKKRHVAAHFHGFSLNLDKNARLKYLYHLDDDPLIYHHHHIDASLEENARFVNYNIIREIQSTTLQRHVDINGEHADCQMHGLYQLEGKQNIDYLLSVNYLIGKSTSTQNFKGILYDESTASFTSNVYVAKEAQHVTSTQLNQSLLFGKHARVNTRPELEIHADDVKCGHGATVGPVDKEQIFYLCSRGIPEKKARKMLAKAFSKDFEKKLFEEFTDTSILKKKFNYLKTK